LQPGPLDFSGAFNGLPRHSRRKNKCPLLALNDPKRTSASRALEPSCTAHVRYWGFSWQQIGVMLRLRLWLSGFLNFLTLEQAEKTPLG